MLGSYGRQFVLVVFVVVVVAFVVVAVVVVVVVVVVVGEYRPAYICHVRDNIKYSAVRIVN